MAAFWGIKLKIEKIFKIVIDRVKNIWYYNHRKADRDIDKYIPTVTIINGYDSLGNYNTVRRDVKWKDGLLKIWLMG